MKMRTNAWLMLTLGCGLAVSLVVADASSKGTRTPAPDALAGTTGTHTAADAISLPTQCLGAKNHGACEECCKAATSCGPPPAPFDCNRCAKFCKNVVPPLPGAPEPAP